MSNQTRDYRIRLSAEGKRRLEQDLKSLGQSGQQSLNLIRKAARPASDGLRHTDRAARDLKGSLASVGSEIPALQRLTRFLGPTAVAGAIAAFGRSSLNLARDFQAAMNRVEAATGVGEAALARLAAAARATGDSTAFTAMEAAGAIETLAKNGVSAEAILSGALDASVALAGALGAELGPSADLVTDIMGQFRLEARELPGIADAIAGAALKSKYGFDDLRMAIAQAGGVAGGFGLSVEDMLATLAATSSSFASGSDAGTSFKNFLQRLTPQSKQAAAAMEELNLEFYRADGSLKPMVEIAGELEEGVKGLSEAARNTALQQIFGTDAIRTALALANSGADAFRDLAAAMGEVSAADQAQVRLKGLDGALKELSAAWEALQLNAQENGGLDTAEAAVRRFTDAIRYLSENFETVEEVVERLAQALTVYLVGKGMTLAIAKAVAMRAAYVHLAASVSGVGVAASRSAVALRALSGALGGPLGIALTAAQVAALFVNLDASADRIESAEAAARRGAEALDRYRDATRRAAEEQAEFGGQVSKATAELVKQSRLELQDSLRALTEARTDLLRDLDGTGAFNVPELENTLDNVARRLEAIRRKGGDNRYLAETVELLREAADGEGALEPVGAAYERFLGVGEEARDLAAAFNEVLMGDGDPRPAADAVLAYAENVEQLADEMKALEGLEPYSAEWFGVVRDIARAMEEGADASRILRKAAAGDFLDLARAAVETGQDIEKVEAALRGVLEVAEEKPTDTGLNKITEEADAARAAIQRLDGVYGDYMRRMEADGASTDRGAWLRGSETAAGKGVLDLIGYAEGTDKGRGYNETLDYGKYTNGPVNLINMTLREVLALQRQILAHPDNPHNSSAVGRYQIVSKTLGGERKDGSGGLIRQMGLSLDDRFTPELQDRMAMELIRQSGMTVRGMRGTWEGLKHVPGTAITTALSGQVVPTADKEVLEARKERQRLAAEEEEALRRLVATGQDQIAQLELEARVAGKTAGEQARLRFMYEALTAAKRAGIDPEKTLTEDGEKLIDVYRRQADALAVRIDRQQQGRQETEADLAQMEESRDALRGAFDNFKAGGEGIKGFFDDMTSYVQGKLWELAFDPVWDFLAEQLSTAFQAIAGSVSATPSVPAAANGGALQGLASGGLPEFSGLIRGFGGKRQDNILVRASRGEFMQPASAVDYYGVGFMEALRQRRFPRSMFQVPALANGGAIGGRPGGVHGRDLAPIINIQNNSSGRITERTETTVDAKGRRRTNLLLADAVGTALTTPGGGARRTLRNNFGVTPKGRRR